MMASPSASTDAWSESDGGPQPVVTFTAILDDTGESASDFVTNDTSLTVTGTYANLRPSDRIQISSDGGHTWHAVVMLEGGSWEYVDPIQHFSSFAYQVRIVNSDSVPGPNTFSLAVTIDITPPTAAVTIDSISNDTGASASDFVTNDQTLTVNGSNTALGAGEKIQISIDNGATWSDVTAIDATHWSYVDPALHTSSFAYQARVIDLAGNQGPNPAIAQVTIDITAPTATVTITAISNDTGPSATDFVTNDTSLTLFGTSDVLGADERIQVSSDNGATWKEVTRIDSTHWSYVDPLTHTANFSYQAHVIDLAGNVGTKTAVQPIVIDGVAPTAIASISKISDDTGASTTDFITSDTSLTLFGTTSSLGSGDRVQVSSDNGLTWSNASVTGIDWTFVDPTLHSADFTYQVRVVDAAGNAGVADQQSIVIDTSAPTIDVDSVTGDDRVTARENAAGFTISGHTGGVEDGQIATINIQDAFGTSVLAYQAVVQNNAWSVQVSSSIHLAAGDYTASAEVSDVAGNVGAAAELFTVVPAPAHGAGAGGPGQLLIAWPGHDVLVGTPGDDTFVGTAGIVMAVIHDSWGDSLLSNVSVVQPLPPFQQIISNDGSDFLFNIQRVQFDDALVGIDVAGNAGNTFRLYQAAFDRTPDTDGLSFNINLVDHGLSLSGLAAAFAASPEFQLRYGANLTDAQYVTTLYANVLHRAPDPAGLAGWEQALAAGQSRGDVLIGFSESAENHSHVDPVLSQGILLNPHYFS